MGRKLMENNMDQNVKDKNSIEETDGGKAIWGVVVVLGLFCIYLTLPLSVFEIDRAVNPVLLGLGSAVIAFGIHKLLNVNVLLLVCIAIPSIAIAYVLIPL